MDDEDRDLVDVDSDEEDTRSGVIDLFDVVIANPTPADKRAHHNALERKRRDHIKESFCSLRDCIPNLNGEKASRAQILKKATDYIASMRMKNLKHQGDIDAMRQQNKSMEDEVTALEKIKATNDFSKNNTPKDAEAGDDATHSDNLTEPRLRRKKPRIS